MHLYRTGHQENKCKRSGVLEGRKGIFESDGLSWKETTILHSYSFIIPDLFASVFTEDLGKNTGMVFTDHRSTFCNPLQA